MDHLANASCGLHAERRQVPMMLACLPGCLSLVVVRIGDPWRGTYDRYVFSSFRPHKLARGTVLNLESHHVHCPLQVPVTGKAVGPAFDKVTSLPCFLLASQLIYLGRLPCQIRSARVLLRSNTHKSPLELCHMGLPVVTLRSDTLDSPTGWRSSSGTLSHST